MNQDLAYLNYWKRKELLKSEVPAFPLLRWWSSEDLCEVEKVIFSQLKGRDTVLDVGAGDLRTMLKFQQASYSGKYHTQDIGEEFTYTYKSLEEIKHKYAVILCLDVIEHLQLLEGLTLIHRLVNLLETGGVIVIQTPNARCIRNPLSWDMTHLHCYNINDLWSYLTCMELQVEGYRVVFGAKKRSWTQQISNLLSSYIITRFLGLDYADNIVLIATKLGVK
jgi:predicted SAM-dependent methyltransferase